MGSRACRVRPDGARAEFAILVRSDMQGRGLGALLMDKIVRYCRTRGVGELVGDVLATNVRIMALAREIGFERVASDEPGVVRISLKCIQAPATMSKAADYA